jgi:hypothetical protein
MRYLIVAIMLVNLAYANDRIRRPINPARPIRPTRPIRNPGTGTGSTFKVVPRFSQAQKYEVAKKLLGETVDLSIRNSFELTPGNPAVPNAGNIFFRRPHWVVTAGFDQSYNTYVYNGGYAKIYGQTEAYSDKSEDSGVCLMLTLAQNSTYLVDCRVNRTTVYKIAISSGETEDNSKVLTIDKSTDVSSTANHINFILNTTEPTHRIGITGDRSVWTFLGCEFTKLDISSN